MLHLTIFLKSNFCHHNDINYDQKLIHFCQKSQFTFKFQSLRVKISDLTTITIDVLKEQTQNDNLLALKINSDQEGENIEQYELELKWYGYNNGDLQDAAVK